MIDFLCCIFLQVQDTAEFVLNEGFDLGLVVKDYAMIALAVLMLVAGIIQITAAVRNYRMSMILYWLNRLNELGSAETQAHLDDLTNLIGFMLKKWYPREMKLFTTKLTEYRKKRIERSNSS